MSWTMPAALVFGIWVLYHRFICPDVFFVYVFVVFFVFKCDICFIL
jgi:hypothetical protein